jgi:hypothetical protein
MKRLNKILLPAVAVALLAPAGLMAEGPAARVALFEVVPGLTSQFEAAMIDSGRAEQSDSAFIAERVLKNVDPLNPLYAVYTKYDDSLSFAAAWDARVAALRPYLQRDPEVHAASLTDTYTPSLETDTPAGDEFGGTRTGQIAHLGLFIPFPEYRDEYDRILRLVKEDTRQRKPHGFIGEDVLVEQTPASVEAQSPYTPRALELTPMSLNYGEFASIEDAENAYIQRAADRTDDPRLRYWYRAFFGALQVPSRFYIFRVIGNFPEAPALLGRAPSATSAPTFGAASK